MEKKSKEDVRRSFLTYFVLFFPTLIVAAIPETINGSFFSSTAIKVLLAFYQFVAIKSFVDTHYEG